MEGMRREGKEWREEGKGDRVTPLTRGEGKRGG